jgi:hypothetical protein
MAQDVASTYETLLRFHRDLHSPVGRVENSASAVLLAWRQLATLMARCRVRRSQGLNSEVGAYTPQPFPNHPEAPTHLTRHVALVTRPRDGVDVRPRSAQLGVHV